MILNRDRQKFVRAVGFLIILQGLAWLALALAGIIVNSSPPDNVTSGFSGIKGYGQYLAKIIYDDFMSDNRAAGKVIRPQDFQAFLWIYAILSAVWVAAALDQNFAIRYKKPRQSYITLVLGVVILVTAVIDLVFFALLARDFSSCQFDLTTNSPSSTTVTTTATSATTTTGSTSSIITTTESSGTQIDCQVASGIVMSVAARGYVLWIINVILSICLIKIGSKAIRAPSLLTYGNSTIPRAWVPEQMKQPSPNNELNFFGDNETFASPAPPLNQSKNRNSTPVSLANKNQGIYY